ncbi:hypothetical protein AKO1_014407 [Acrasis kona]|uniref:Pentatricopeptide repeat-containing protein n=1 Tax=Acrasis kona TaxID=1008807 RepID=A0AAW2YZG7_9EUKA
MMERACSRITKLARLSRQLSRTYVTNEPNSYDFYEEFVRPTPLSEDERRLEYNRKKKEIKAMVDRYSSISQHIVKPEQLSINQNTSTTVRERYRLMDGYPFQHYLFDKVNNLIDKDQLDVVCDVITQASLCGSEIQPDILNVSLGALIKAHQQERAFELLLILHSQNHKISTKINSVKRLLRSLIASRRLFDAQKLFDIIDSQDKKFNLYSMMMEAYINVRDMDSARHVFNQLNDSGNKPPMVTFDAVVSGHFGKEKQVLTAGDGKSEEPYDIKVDFGELDPTEIMSQIKEIDSTGSVPQHVMCFAVKNCKHSSFEELCQLGAAIAPYASDVIMFELFCNMIPLENVVPSQVDAIFGDAIKGVSKDSVLLYSVLVERCFSKSYYHAGMWLVREMRSRGLEVSDTLASCAKKFLDDQDVEEDMREQAYSELGLERAHTDTIEEKNHVNVNKRTIKELCDAGDLDGAIKQCGENTDLSSMNSILNALFREGRFDDGNRTFQLLIKNGLTPDVVTFNCMISGLVRNKMHKQAIKLHDEMQELYKVEPDRVTYVIMKTVK